MKTDDENTLSDVEEGMHSKNNIHENGSNNCFDDLIGTISKEDAGEMKKIKRFKLLNMDAGAAQHSVSTKLDLFARETSFPENDIWIAACAIQHQLAVYTKNIHFKNITGLNLV